MKKPYWIGIACFALGFSEPAKAQPSDVPLDPFWRVNGVVWDIAVTGNSAYLGGAFTYTGPANGCAGAAELATGASSSGFPEFSGIVYCIVSDGEGGWYVGGQFVEASTGLKNLVHVQADQTIRRSWAPKPDGVVRALALGSGKLFVGGDFDQIAGVSRQCLVALELDVVRTNPWPARANNAVHTMVLAGDTLYVGGEFTKINNVNRARLASIDANTAGLGTWDPGVSGGDNIVYTLAVDGSLVYVGGNFTTCGTKPRNRIAAVDATTGVANNWNPNASHTSGSASVHGIVVKPNAVYVGGYFTAIGGRNRSHLAALSRTTGQADATWDPSPNGWVKVLLPQGTDLLVGGQFTQIANEDRLGVAMLEVASAALKPWFVGTSSLRPGVTPIVRAMAVDNQQVAIGGDFVSIGGVIRNRLAALDLTTGQATRWNPGADGDVYDLCLGTNGLFVGGVFNNIGGAAIPRLAQVNLADGQALDWNPFSSVSGNHCVVTMVRQGERLYVGGYFNAMGGESRNNLAELDLADATATAWNPAPQGVVRQLLVRQDRLYVAGEYSGIASGNRAYLSAFELANKALVTAFDPKPDAAVRALALEGDRLYVGGDFSRIATQTRSRLATINPDTGMEDELWNPEVGISGTLRVFTLAPAVNSVYAGGSFTAVGGEFRTALAGVTTLMGSANGWNPSPDGIVRTVVIADALLFVGGEFTKMGGVSWPYFAVFSGAPSFLPGSLRVKANGNVEFQVLDGDGHGSNLLLQATDDLVNPSWQTLLTQPVFGLATPFEDSDAAGKAHRIYRALAEP